jgi:hypothetical protein
MMTDERDDDMIVAWMRQFAALPIETSSLPDPAYLWWKAQLLRRWDAQRTVVAPLDVGERVQVATGLVGAAILLALLWSSLPTLAAPSRLASPNLMITIAAAVLLLTAALVAGWWRALGHQ